MENNKNNTVNSEISQVGMSRKFCPSCGAMNLIDSNFCMLCGTKMPEVVQSTAEAQPMGAVQPIAEAQPVAEAQFSAQHVAVAQHAAQTEQNDDVRGKKKNKIKKDKENRRSKKGIKIVAIVVSAVMLIAGIGVGVWFLGADDRIVSEAEKYIEDGDYAKAYELLKQVSDSEKADAAIKKWNKTVTESIYALMGDGDYIAAKEMLDQCPDITDGKLIEKQIKYEQFALVGLMDLRKLYKNPSSMQLNDIEFYESEYEYPWMITTTSGQNGFGGYSTSLETYDVKTLKFSHSTDTMDYDEAEDANQLLVIMLIEACREGPECDFDVDIQRVNNVLQGGKSPKIDIEQYKQARKDGTNT